MQKVLNPLVLQIIIFVTPLFSQSFTIKPFYGYLRPQMTDVNRRIDTQMEAWRELLEEPLPSPGKISGQSILGGEIQCHLNEEYFLGLNISRYKDQATTDYRSQTAEAPGRFLYMREVEALDVALHLDSFLGYDESSRFNKYFGIGLGVILVKAKSVTQSTFELTGSKVTLPLVDTTGDFSGTAFTALLSGGLDFKLAGPVSLWSEAGYRYAKLGQLEGTVRQLNSLQNTSFTTNTSFDFSGFYLQAGLGMGLSF